MNRGTQEGEAEGESKIPVRNLWNANRLHTQRHKHTWCLIRDRERKKDALENRPVCSDCPLVYPLGPHMTYNTSPESQLECNCMLGK